MGDEGGLSIDPLLTLYIPSVPEQLRSATAFSKKHANVEGDCAVNSLCFIAQTRNEGSISEYEHDDGAVFFSSCKSLVQRDNPHMNAHPKDGACSSFISKGRKIVSCHSDGKAFVWDLNHRNIVSAFGTEDRRLGLCVRRLSDLPQHPDKKYIFYQTRDSLGTITLHDAENEMSVVNTWETQSRTFCAASPCQGEPNLIALPSPHESYVTIRDRRVSQLDKPAFCFHAATGAEKYGRSHKAYGMMTSVAMKCDFGDSGRRAVVACGMENGTLALHDLLMTSKPGQFAELRNSSTVSIGTDPILSVDLASSSSPKTSNDALLAVLGLAGDAVEIENSKPTNRGRVAAVKAVSNQDTGQWTARIRSRIGIGNGATARKGKSGISICRFRPDGRIFAAGGWDRRVRIYSRSGNGIPLALLKGHNGTADAIDWALDSDSSGLIATGSSDGMICVWRCFNTG